MQKKSDGDFCSSLLDFATYRAVRCHARRTTERTTPPACKKIGRSWVVVFSQCRNLPPGQVPRKKNNASTFLRPTHGHARPSPGTEPGKEVMSLERAASDLNGKAWGRPRWSLTAAPQDASLPSGGLCLFYFGKEMKAGGRDVRGELLRERTGFEQVGRGRRKMPCRSEVRGKLLRERTGFEQVGLGRSSTSLPR